MDAAALWHKTTTILAQQFPRANFNLWIKPTIGLDLKNHLMIIGVPHVYAKNMLEQRFYQQIKPVVDKVAGQPLDLEFVVSTKALPSANTALNGPLFETEDRLPSQPSPDQELIELGLNPHYTFDTFVVGNSNNFAHAAAQAAISSPGTTYNPLFIYGGTGVGKTHLLHAIAHALIQSQPNGRILCLRCEQFTNEIISALKQGNIQTVRNKFRRADVLLIDDVQFVAGKDFCQEEFFNTFNQLHLANKQIVISSDRAPRDIPKLESRLVSRFLGGLTVDIQPPDYEMRVAIIKIKAAGLKVKLGAEVLDYLASRIQTNIRELEGTVFSLLTASRLEKTDPNLAFFKKRLGEIDRQARPCQPKEVPKIVAQHFNLKPKDLAGTSRKAEFVYPRQLAMYLLRNEFRQSYEAVGDLFGGRDHTTVMHAVAKIGDLKNNDPATQKYLVQLKDKLLQPLST